MGDTVQEIETIVEEITNTTDVPGSVSTLIDWFQGLLGRISTSDHPASIAANSATVIAQNKDALSAAVTANTTTDGEALSRN